MVCIYTKLLSIGAKVAEPAVVSPDRLKSFGRMWRGHATLELNGELFRLELWHHGGHEETVESLLPHFSLKGISNSTRVGFDCNWHTVITPWGILYSKDGWFRDTELCNKIGSYNNNFPDRITEKEVERLLAIGLQWLIQW